VYTSVHLYFMLSSNAHGAMYTHTRARTRVRACVFFSDAVSDSGCIPSNGRILMNGDLERSYTWYVLHKWHFIVFQRKLCKLILSSAVKCLLVLPVEFFPPATLLPCYLPPFPVHNYGCINHLSSVELCHLIKSPLLVLWYVVIFQDSWEVMPCCLVNCHWQFPAEATSIFRV